MNLTCISLKGCSGKLLSYLDIRQLRTLEIYQCRHTGSFLLGITEPLRCAPHQLSVLRIQLSLQWQQSSQTVDKLNSFLRRLHGLLELELDLEDCGSVKKDSILSHASTLVSLVISTSHSQQRLYYDYHAMAEILRRCQNLEYIAINMPPVKLGRLMDLGEGFHVGSDRFAAAYVSTEFEAILVSLLIQRKRLPS